MLVGRLDRPLGPPRAYALFAHCFTCSKDIAAASRIAAGLADQGIATLRFDFTGLGHSGGEFANSNFSSNIEDLVAAADYLRDEHEAPRLLIGHSLGGAAVLAAAARIPEAVAVATIGAPADPSHVSHLFDAHAGEIEATGEALVTLAGREFRIKKQFLEDIADQPLQKAIGALRKALIVFHAPRDQTVSIDDAGRIFQAARHPKSFVSLDDADHLLTRKSDATYVANVLSAWAERFLPEERATPTHPREPGIVTVSENHLGKFSQDIAVGNHHWHADEPITLGGDDTGLTPYQLLSASLGACTTMTIRMYADRKGWPLENVAVAIGHDKIHAEDCADCETREGRVDRFERTLSLDGPLDDHQRQSLLAIADKCPVHRTLHSEIVVETRLEERMPQA